MRNRPAKKTACKIPALPAGRPACRQAGVIWSMSKKDINEEKKSQTSKIIKMFEVIPV
jgi:hypothetical protein